MAPQLVCLRKSYRLGEGAVNEEVGLGEGKEEAGCGGGGWTTEGNEDEASSMAWLLHGGSKGGHLCATEI